MAASSFDEALRRLLAHEGGYSNHPSDPGGPTNYGITIHDYRRYVKPGAGAADVKAMRLAQAKEIYREKYWRAQRCDELPAGIDYAVFDYGVHSGIGRSGKVLRRVLRLDDASHVITDGVVAAAGDCAASEIVAAICDERLAFLRRLKTWPVFGAGWGRRVAEVRRAALAMTGIRPAVAVSGTRAAGKGSVPPHTGTQIGTAAGVATAGVAAAQQAHQAGAGPNVVIAIIIAAALLACASWWWWRRRRLRQQES